MRPSKIDRMPQAVRERIGELRDNGRTIDEILDALRDMGETVSRSALGHHTQMLDAAAERVRESRGLAEALVKRYGEARDGDTARLNIELMHGLLAKTLLRETDGAPVEFAPREMAALAATVRSLALAQKSDVEREKTLRAALAEKACKIVRKAGVSGGVEAKLRAGLAPT